MGLITSAAHLGWPPAAAFLQAALTLSTIVRRTLSQIDPQDLPSIVCSAHMGPPESMA